MPSIWNKTTDNLSFETLNGDIETEVLIIGGGISGILCAHELTNAGVDNILVEATKICSGITQNTTAKITLAQRLVYSELIKKLGVGKAKAYLEAQLGAIEKYKRLCRDINCDFEECDSLVYSLKDRQGIENEVMALKKLGFTAELREKTELPFKVSGALAVSGQAQFHPLKFIHEIIKGLNVYENTKVLEIRDKEIVTNRGKIKAQKIIVATHFPFINKHGGYFIKMFQERSYVIALKNAETVTGMYVDEDKKGLSFRSYGNLLLLGGGSHRTGKKGGAWQELEAFAKRYYPDSDIVCRWATQDCITLDGLPYIGQYSSGTPNMYVATGFNKWGMTASMIAAQVLKALILGEGCDCADIVSPQRSVLHPQLAINVGESLLGIITPTVPRCPHLGCALKYNRAEHSWDCSCHGSRFTDKGELINGPSTDDKQL